jgi:KDO2-lipid IV(A) lauroyltransferase
MSPMSPMSNDGKPGLSFRAAAAAVRALPDAAARAAARTIGASVYAVDRSHRRVAEANVAAAFPARTPAEHRAVVRAAFHHFSTLLVELLRFSSLPPAEMLARVEFEGDEHVHEAYAKGRGVIFVTGHFGFWELQGLVNALHYEPISVVARPLDNASLHALVEQIRTATGNSVIYRTGTFRRILRTLHAGHGVGMLIDQHVIDRDAITIEFFNRPAASTPLVGAMAARTGASVIPMFALPLGGGRYQMVAEPSVAPPASEHADDIVAFAQRCSDVIEMYVRRHPELWLWMHRRWRTEKG